MHNRAGSVPTSSTIASEEAEKWWSTYTKTATSMIQEVSLGIIAATFPLLARITGPELARNE